MRGTTVTHKLGNLLKVNVRVRDLDEALAFFQDALGAELIHNRGSDTIGDFNGATARIGDVVLDFVAPNTEHSALAKNIEARGQGLDSICFQVDNLEDTAEALRSREIELINRHDFHGSKIGFIHPRDAFGMLIELIERPAE